MAKFNIYHCYQASRVAPEGQKAPLLVQTLHAITWDSPKRIPSRPPWIMLFMMAHEECETAVFTSGSTQTLDKAGRPPCSQI